METKEPCISISEFKATCLHLLEEVAIGGKALTITKRGQPLVRVVPIQTANVPLRGSWKGRVKIKGDIVNFNVADEWESAR